MATEPEKRPEEEDIKSRCCFPYFLFEFLMTFDVRKSWILLRASFLQQSDTVFYFSLQADEEDRVLVCCLELSSAAIKKSHGDVQTCFTELCQSAIKALCEVHYIL